MTGRVLIILAVSSVAIISDLHAGPNDDARVRLSWEPNRLVSDLESPSSSEVDLYARLSGADDIHNVCIKLRWICSEDSSACIRHIQGIPDHIGCGNLTSLIEMSENRWAIDWVAPRRNLIRFRFDVSQCSVPASFYVDFVEIKDSYGRATYARPTGQPATLRGGSPRSPKHELIHMSQRTSLAGDIVRISDLIGAHLPPLANLFLRRRNDGAIRSATEITIDAHQVSCTIPTTSEDAGEWDVILNSQGRDAVYESGVLLFGEDQGDYVDLLDRGICSDYIMIVPNNPALLGEAMAMRDHIEARAFADSHGVLIADMDSIHHHFGWTDPDTTVIKEFIQYAYDYWASMPQHLLLVGDADIEGSFDILPTLYRGYRPPGGSSFGEEYAYDDGYVLLDDADDVPDMIVARLPVRVQEDLANYRIKLEEYESIPANAEWSDNIFFAVGDRASA